jgi:hypothetical protein
MKNFIALQFILFYTISNSMGNDSLYYKIKPTKECIEYIRHSGIQTSDWSNYEINSRKGLVYVLPSGEFVLIPSNLDEEYPGIIFKDREIFQHYVDLDSFPIGINDMTWFEKHSSEMQHFLTSPDFYRNELIQVRN